MMKKCVLWKAAEKRIGVVGLGACLHVIAFTAFGLWRMTQRTLENRRCGYFGTRLFSVHCNDACHFPDHMTHKQPQHQPQSIEHVQAMIAQSKQRIVESLERSVKDAQDSEQLGAASLAELDRQEDVLRRIESRSEHAQGSLVVADRHAVHMGSWMRYLFFKSPSNRAPKPNRQEAGLAAAEEAKPAPRRVMHAPSQDYDEPEPCDEEERLMRQLQASVLNLRQIGLAMQDSLVESDAHIDRVRESIDTTQHGLTKVSGKVRHLLYTA